MANIFQIIKYSSFECEILDFINKHKDIITYTEKETIAKNGYPAKQHCFSIKAEDITLKATLCKARSSLFTQNNIDYTDVVFICNKPCENLLCCNKNLNLSDEKCAFTDVVYNTMLKQYKKAKGKCAFIKQR